MPSVSSAPATRVTRSKVVRTCVLSCALALGTLVLFLVLASTVRRRAEGVQRLEADVCARIAQATSILDSSAASIEDVGRAQALARSASQTMQQRGLSNGMCSIQRPRPNSILQLVQEAEQRWRSSDSRSSE